MSSKLNIDLLNRDSLVNLGTKLNINGFTNSFNSPYLKKDEIKSRILFFFKEHKKKIRSKSLNNTNSLNQTHLNRSKSLPNIRNIQNSNNLINFSRSLLLLITTMEKKN